MDDLPVYVQGVAARFAPVEQGVMVSIFREGFLKSLLLILLLIKSKEEFHFFTTKLYKLWQAFQKPVMR